LARRVLALCALALLHNAALAQEQRLQSELTKAAPSEVSGQEPRQWVERDRAGALAQVCPAPHMGGLESRFELDWSDPDVRAGDRAELSTGRFFHVATGPELQALQRAQPSLGMPMSGNAAVMRPGALAGALPRVVEVTPAKSMSSPGDVMKAAPPDIVNLVKKIAPEYRVEPGLVLTIMEIESKFDTIAVSPKNAMGLMQLIPETAARFKVGDAFDAAQNIRGGTAYLRWLLAYFEGDVSLVAAAYNSGERNVERYRGVPPFLETREYVRKVIAALGEIKLPFDPRITQPSPFLRPLRDLSASR
jgi:hypothetical protein